VPINLRPHSSSGPLWVEDEEYHRLVGRKDLGWSQCSEEMEWLAKLHYLREGLRAGKLSRPDFLERESKLVEVWLRKGT